MTNTNISLAHLRVLTAIADSGSFSAAAEEVGITQSGVSQSVRHLENVLGVTLLVRHRRGVSATELGQAVIRDARDAIQAIERMRQRCTAATGLQSGRVRIGSVPSAASRLLPKKLAEFQRLYPNVSVELMEGTDGEVCEWVENGIVDLALSGECTPNAAATVIAKDEFVLVVGHKHRLARRRAARLKEIVRERFLMSASGCEPAIRRIFERDQINPTIAFRVRDADALANMVDQGLGVTIMPRLAVPVKLKSIVCLSIEPRSHRQIVAITKRGQESPPAVDKLRALLIGAYL
jgi:molybdate transport repressor ModE-like protein